MSINLSKAETAELQQLIDAYDTARSALCEHVSQLAVDWRDEFDGKSEKWQSSEQGQKALERVEWMESAGDQLPSETDIYLDNFPG